MLEGKIVLYTSLQSMMSAKLKQLALLWEEASGQDDSNDTRKPTHVFQARLSFNCDEDKPVKLLLSGAN